MNEMNEWMNEWMDEWNEWNEMNEWIRHKLLQWLSVALLKKQMNEWNEWMNEWNEWMNEWIRHILLQWQIHYWKKQCYVRYSRNCLQSCRPHCHSSSTRPGTGCNHICFISSLLRSYLLWSVSHSQFIRKLEKLLDSKRGREWYHTIPYSFIKWWQNASNTI